MSVHWNPGKATVDLNGAAKPRPSIRRTPIAAPAKVIARRSDETETWLGMLGVVSIAGTIVAAIVAAAYVTYSKGDTGAPPRSFSQCYAAQGPNCIIDGDTIRMSGETIQIAGLDTPKVAGYRCEAERTAGITAAVELLGMLNAGPVSVGDPFRDAGGRTVRKVFVKGQEVRDAMIERGFGRRYDAESTKGWC